MKLPDRLGVVHASLILFAIALIGKAGYEQLYRGSYWKNVGRRQQYSSAELAAQRGEILDADGGTLAESQEVIQIQVAPRDILPNRRIAFERAMQRAHVDPRWITRALDPKRRWVEIPQHFLPVDIAPVLAFRGVHSQPAMDRVYATSPGVRRIVGRVDPTGKPQDGVELILNDVLRGDTASVRVAHDENGKPLDVPTGANGNTAGNTVVLTLNRNLQDICDRALANAVDSLHATGGDIVVMNPNTGDLLAASSLRSDPRAIANTAVSEPYEPGSTVKPFVAARLLGLGRARPDEVINTYGGHLTLDGRKIDDAEEHPAMMTLSEVIQHSSNVGIVLFGSRLTPREKYELLRDAGFGTPTTILLPGESPGTLREPVRWSKTSAASVVMGYEIAVTPLQIVTAYSAIANGGELLEPHIVKEVRSPTGEVLYSARRRVVRQIMTSAIAATIRQMLRDVVTGGTSTKADLQTLDVAGKSGTARENIKGHYENGAYTASFVGLFPNDHPQFVVLVKLDRPQNGYYGGVVAGGVTNIVLRAALAARDAALDLGELASSVHAPRPDTSLAARQAAKARAAAESARAAATLVKPAPPAPADTDPRTSSSYVVDLPFVRRVAPVAATVRPIPDVKGMAVRDAVRTLHAAGFRVQIVPGPTIGTTPVAGTPWLPGRVVKLSMPE